MSAGPWERFALRAEGAENCGYFEWRSALDPRVHRSISFDRPRRVIQIDTPSDWTSWAQAAGRIDRGRSRRLFLGYLGFDAAVLFDRAYGSPPGGSPFPSGLFAELEGVRPTAFPAPRFSVRPGSGSPPSDPPDSIPRPRFLRGVARLQRAIRRGDAYQVVLAHRRTFARPADLLRRAGALRRRERFAFFYYLRFGDIEVVGASPESVVERAGARAFISPIAGTRPPGSARGPRGPLQHDRKELAEHRMLVDLARNDLGRVAVPGSVRLEYLERRQRFARVEHLVSRVSASLPPALTTPELLASAFPAGTVCGAPKVRATALLRATERTWRGPYGGAVGFLRPGRDSAWALAIRSAFVRGDELFTAAGAGIVSGSRPSREWQETLDKLEEVEATLVGEAVR